MSLANIRAALEVEIVNLQMRELALQNTIANLKFMLLELSDEKLPNLKEVFTNGAGSGVGET